MVNIGIVGLGFMGVTHIRAYRKIPNARLAAICDAYRLPLDGDFSKISGNVGEQDPVKLDMRRVKAYKDFAELLANPEIDLVDVCVPTLAHPQSVIAALEAGKHVLCEKPMARTAKLARDMADAAAKAKGYLMPAMCIRFWPEYAWVKNAIQNKTFGAAVAARFRRVSEPPAWSRETYFDGQQSGGAILDLHIHDTDFVQFCFGRPRSVFSRGISRFTGAIDYVVTQYQVANDVAVHAEGSWIMTSGHGFDMAFTVIFERATVDYDLARGPEALRLFEEGQKPRTVRCEGTDGYVGELSHMVDSIQSGRPPSIVTAKDGLSAVEICEAEEKSVKTGQLVAL